MQTLKFLLFLCFIQFSFGLKASDLLQQREDTVLVNELNYTDRPLIMLSEGKYVDIPYHQMYRSYPFKVYLTKDTSLFNGFLIHEQRQNPYIGYFKVNTWEFKDGSPVSLTIYDFVASPDTMNHYLFPFYHFSSAFKWKGSVSHISKNWTRNGVIFFPNGDTSQVYRNDIDGRTIMTTKFYPNRDTLSYANINIIDGLEVLKEFERNEKGELTQYCLVKKNIDNEGFESMICYEIDADRDTVYFRKLMNGIEYHRESIRNDNGKLLTIRKTFEKGKLKDIENENILYLNEKFEIITEEMFLQTINSSYSFNELYIPFYSQNGQQYELVFFPDYAHIRGRKYEKKLNKYARNSLKNK